MMSSILRSVVTRSALAARTSTLAATRISTRNSVFKSFVALARPERAFSVSALAAFPVAKTTKKSTSGTKTSTTGKATARTAAKKPTARAGAAKKKTTTTKKAAPKKRKVAATKKKVTVRKTAKAKKVVPKKPSPRTDPALRAPPRTINPFSLYAKRMYPTLTPKPATVMVGLAQLRVQWNAMTAQEKKGFEDEAAVIKAERQAEYAKWRAGLTGGQVRAINSYRENTKHNKLGPPSRAGKPKKPVTGYVKFYQEKLQDGTISPANTPAGTRFITYASREGSRLWKGLSESQKAAYKP